MSTTGSFELECTKYLVYVSIIIRLLTSEDVELSSWFDKNGENALKDNAVLKKLLIKNLGIKVKKGKIKGHLPLEQIFGFCTTFKKTTKNLGFHPIIKTADLQDIIFTTKATDINVTKKGLYLFVLHEFQIPKRKLCLMKLFKRVLQSLTTHGIQSVNYLLTVMNFKLI